VVLIERHSAMLSIRNQSAMSVHLGGAVICLGVRKTKGSLVYAVYILQETLSRTLCYH
jgi:hypothetical protein